MHTWILVAFVLLVLAPAGTVLLAAWFARDGYEDEGGFHSGVEPVPSAPAARPAFSFVRREPASARPVRPTSPAHLPPTIAPV